MDKECFEIPDKRIKKIRNIFIFFLSLQMFVILSGTDALFPFFIYPMFSYEVAAPKHVSLVAYLVDESSNEKTINELFDLYPLTNRSIGRVLKFVNKSPEKMQSLAERFLTAKPEYKKFRLYSITTDRELLKSIILSEQKISRLKFREIVEIDKRVVYEYPP